ncbi:MAG: hydroxyacylglutathione hydrolase [Silvanigrellales bacterium]|jgi:hydroxyacylglutathione hydrolase|nr:hydroxyacylglutathione hydrolase [Silvanigrellales bacterium]
MVTVELFPAFQDNYVFLLVDASAREAAVVDPGDALGVLGALEAKELALKEIFITHHHADHVGGVKLLKECFPSARVTCGVYDAERKRVPFAERLVQEGDVVTFGGEDARVLDVPGHTKGHIAYHFGTLGMLFIGDTLFGAGSGGLFEGTAAQMLESLKKIRNLPSETLVFCAHEYTEKNLRVALELKEGNPAQRARFEEVAAMRAAGARTVPLLLAEEKETNPFLRWDAPSLRKALGTGDDLSTFAAVRAFRDRF